MPGLEDEANQKASRCSKGRVLIVLIVVVLCVSGAGLGIYFAINKPHFNAVTSTEEPRAGVSFALSKSAVHIGDNHVGMNCIVKEHRGLKRVDILKDEVDIIATITSESSYVNRSSLTLIEGHMTTDSANLRLLFSHPLACQDKGRYYCVATGDLVVNETFRLVSLRRPNKPTLLLSRDIVEERENLVDLPHTCEANVGYPPGKIVLESNFTILESNFTTYFYPNITKLNMTISDESCQAYQTITFYNVFSRRWHGKELRCSAVNEKSLDENEIPPFDLKVVEVLPADYCMDRPGQYYYHPYNCRNFIECTKGTVHVEVCPETTCFGLNETTGCSVCKESECVPSVVANVCSRSNVDELVPYPHIRCSMYVNCTDRMVHECHGNECFDVLNKICPSRTPTTPSTPERNITCSVSETTTGLNASIVCKIGDVNLTSISVIFISYQHEEVEMFYVTVVDGPGVLQRKNESSLTLNGEGLNQTLSIDLHPLQCHLHGHYSIIVNKNFVGMINITDDAEAPLIIIANNENANENEQLEIRCRGNVGAPAKGIFLEVRYDETSSFHMLPAHNITNATRKDCDNERETNFTLKVTSNLNNSLVRCSVQNEDHSVVSSDERRINIVAPTVTMETSKSMVYIGDEDFSMKCIVLEHNNLSRVEIYHESKKLGTREIIAILTEQISHWTNRSGIVVSESMITAERAFLQINFTNVTCADDGMYQCVAIGKFTFMSSLELDISSEPNVPTLRPSPWIVENKPILRDRMFRCEGMVGNPTSQMFVQANISGSFQEYFFPTIPSENNATELQCNTKLLYQFYYTFNMSWHGSAISCAVTNARTNEIMRSSLHILQIISENYCVGKEDNSYPHPYECQKFISCNNFIVYAVYTCSPTLCFGVNQTSTSGCTYCSDTDLECYPGAHK